MPIVHPRQINRLASAGPRFWVICRAKRSVGPRARVRDILALTSADLRDGAMRASSPNRTSCVRRVRVLLAGMPRMLADIISAIVASQTDFELVGDVVGTAGLALAASQAAADILIRGGRLQRRQALRLLWRAPRMKIVTIDPDGHGGVLYELRLDCAVLDEISPIALVAAIRGGPENSDQRAGR
jgi:hypothetical protein